MRSFRTAAVAGATAVALAFGTTAVATAQTEGELLDDQFTTQSQPVETDPIDQGGDTIPVEDHTPSAPEPEEPYEPSLSSRISEGSSVDFEADQPAQGPAVFGSSKDLGNQPVWAQLLYGASLLGGVGSLIGLIVGPIVNFLNHGL